MKNTLILVTPQSTSELPFVTQSLDSLVLLFLNRAPDATISLKTLTTTGPTEFKRSKEGGVVVFPPKTEEPTDRTIVKVKEPHSIPERIYVATEIRSY